MRIVKTLGKAVEMCFTQDAWLRVCQRVCIIAMMEFLVHRQEVKIVM
jgi:hypothetical protein